MSENEKKTRIQFGVRKKGAEKKRKNKNHNNNKHT